MRSILFLAATIAAFATLVLFMPAFPNSSPQEGLVPESPGIMLLTIALAAALTALHHVLYCRPTTALAKSR